MKRTTVDVVISAYKPDDTFRELIGMLLGQTYPVSHILIINTEERFWNEKLIGNTDRADVFHITKKEFDHAATRNMGAGFSDADYLMFMTQDALPADLFLVERLLSAFENPIVKAAYARQMPGRDCVLTEGCVRSFNYPENSWVRTFNDLPKYGIKTYFCSNVCAMYEMHTFRQMGGFLPPAIFNEDMVYAARIQHLGYGVAYCADARVYHSHNYTASQQFHRNFDNGVSQAMRPEIFRGVSSAGEGRKMVRFVTDYLRKAGKTYLLPGFYRECFAKLAGFRLGKMYRLLPRKMVKSFSMNPDFFDSSAFSRFQHK